LQVQDNGSGLEAEYCAQAFELFRRLHPESGRGVGLALCRNIVENHNGNISLNSKKDQGSQVTILLPLAQEQPFATQLLDPTIKVNMLPNEL
jgi:signal transduction histidine kinase